jgi:hypothetical protein
VPSQPADEDLELLRRHAPRLVFDSIEALRPTRVDAYLAGSVVLDREERVIAGSGLEIERARGQRDWMLNPLPDLPGGSEGERGELRADALLARYEAHQDPAAQGTCYGRVARSGGAIFLQYWCFYVDNPCVLAPGRHDGDWEFVQIRLTERERRPTHITVAQHGAPETRRLSAATRHPEVFVASASHASYLTEGSQPRLPIADICDAGRRPPRELVVEPMPAAGWPYWRGRWGTDKGVGTWLAIALHRPRTPVYLRWLNRLGAGDSPPSPRWQHISWSAPLTFQTQGAAHRFTRVAWRGFLQRVGHLSAPRRSPEIRVVRAGATSVSISARARGHILRRAVRVSVALEDAATTRLLAMHTVAADGRRRDFDLVSAGAIRWRAAGYNRLRQRGPVSEPAAVEASGSTGREDQPA